MTDPRRTLAHAALVAFAAGCSGNPDVGPGPQPVRDERGPIVYRPEPPAVDFPDIPSGREDRPDTEDRLGREDDRQPVRDLAEWHASRIEQASRERREIEAQEDQFRSLAKEQAGRERRELPSTHDHRANRRKAIRSGARERAEVEAIQQQQLADALSRLERAQRHFGEHPRPASDDGWYPVTGP